MKKNRHAGPATGKREHQSIVAIARYMRERKRERERVVYYRLRVRARSTVWRLSLLPSRRAVCDESVRTGQPTPRPPGRLIGNIAASTTLSFPFPLSSSSSVLVSRLTTSILQSRSYSLTFIRHWHCCSHSFSTLQLPLLLFFFLPSPSKPK
jgi:hypothetical protein